VNLKIEGKGDNNEHLVVFRSADAPTILVIKKNPHRISII
jgi:hypothetical protein